MKVKVNYTNGSPSAVHDSIQEAVETILSHYPDGVIYDAGGFERASYSPDSAYDVRNGRAALVWRNEAESVNDDGARAIASINID